MTCTGPSRPNPLAGIARGLVVLALLALAGCRDAVLAHGDDPATARRNAAAFASALEHRFTEVERDAKFRRARLRFARYALAPSKLAEDTALWTSMGSARTGVLRDLTVVAALDGGHYRFAARRDGASPGRTGDERHVMQLQQVGADDYRWRTEVEHAVGGLSAARAGAVFRALFAGAERPPAAVRADYAVSAPTATDVLGRLLRLDSIDATPLPDGSTLVALRVLVDARPLERDLPAFARYVEQYVYPASYRFRLTDRTGADWFDAEARRRILTIRFRSRGGELQPLIGARRPMPDSLVLHVDAAAKLGLFTVGVRRMEGDFVHLRRPGERGWAMRFRREPEWRLPLVTEQLLRAPLRRPFEGDGILFALSLRDAPGGQTLLTRTLDGTVRESAITRFLGNLGFGAMSDFAGKVEEEENRFLVALFGALRRDVAGPAPSR
jgi:hypothetical protein